MKIFYFIIFFLFHKILSDVIRIIATKEVKTYCDYGLYVIEIKVIFNSPFENYYSFDLNIETPEQIKFKCFLFYKNSTIYCSANLDSNKFKIKRTEIIKLPNKFPIIKGFVFDYDSFVKNIYEKELVMEYSCKEKNDKYISNNQWGFNLNITSIYDNKCTYSRNVEENKYVFNMKVNVLDGLLKNELDKINKDKIDTGFLQYEFLQEIWLPILIGDNLNAKFEKNNDFPFSFCSTKEKISNLNLNKLIKEGFDFECYIPIPEEQAMTGIIQIKPFYDQIYMKIINEVPNDNRIIFINIFFNINRTIEATFDIINDNNSSFSNDLELNEKTNLRRNQEITDNITHIINNNEIENNSILIDKESETNLNLNSIINYDNQTQIKIEEDLNLTTDKNDSQLIDNQIKNYTTIDYFLIKDGLNKLLCPDKPIFTIESLKDIQLQSSQEKNYIFFLKGKLSFKYHQEKNNMNDIEFNTTTKNITFNLQVIDNLAENEDNQKSIVNCIIPNNTNFFNRSIPIYCYGNKLSEESMKKNDTDITLNWGIDVNRIHDEIIIKWPQMKKKIKHMYSYTIKAFSLSQKNYGCFNNEFYFYMYIFNLDYEPDILFEVKMKNPKQPKAICKIYDSSSLKCYFPLYKDRITKNTKISLPTNVSYEISDERGNKIIFIVDDYDHDYEDFHLIVKESCGDYIFIGALRNAGLSYFNILMGIIGIGAFIFVILICFICYIKYKIKHRNRKGQYFAHIEEGDNSNIKAKRMELGSSIRK